MFLKNFRTKLVKADELSRVPKSQWVFLRLLKLPKNMDFKLLLARGKSTWRVQTSAKQLIIIYIHIL